MLHGKDGTIPGSPRTRQAAVGGRVHVTYIDLKKPVVKFTQDTHRFEGGPKAGACERPAPASRVRGVAEAGLERARARARL
ncbi:hypothetical protein JL720_15373 [Aureococcus anophagefferens]|nr:hypothetical protein JL720_15373 [Aureococcus anophagefferens]